MADTKGRNLSTGKAKRRFTERKEIEEPEEKRRLNHSHDDSISDIPKSILKNPANASTEDSESAATPKSILKKSSVPTAIAPKSILKLPTSGPKPIKMSLNSAEKKTEGVPTVKKPSQSVASVFNADESDEEEMPPEAKLRMKNVGRFTPTAAGPNSFGKGNHGFVDRRGLMKKSLEKCWDEADK